MLRLKAGSDLSAAVCEPVTDLRRFLSRASGSPEAIPGAFTLKPGGEARWCRCQAALVRPAGSGARTLLIVRFLPQESAGRAFIALTETVNQLNKEIHAHMQAQRALEETVREKEVLLQELQHRVRNNLQLLLTIMGMAMRKEQDANVLERLGAVRDRIYAIAAVQDLIHEATNMAALDASSLIERLCEQIQGSTAPDNVTISTDVEPAVLSPEASVHLSLVVTELITNAIKHAFPDARPGRIRVRFRKENDHAALLVSDNGVRLGGTDDAGRGIGGQIVGAMAKNLDAEVWTRVENGTTVALRFPVRGS